MNDIIRIGVVSAVSPGDCAVRVHFPSEDMVSGWLKVIKSPPAVTAKATATAESSVSGSESSEEDAKNNNLNVDVDVNVDVEAEAAPWFPAVGDTVLCIYNPGFNEDGFVIGGL